MPSFFRGNHTEDADTAITEVIPPHEDMVVRLDYLRYLNSINAHTLTIMRPIATATVTKDAAAGDTRFELGPHMAYKRESLTTSDWLIWVDEHGSYYADVITSMVGNFAVLTDVLPTKVEEGAKVWALYEVGRSTHTQLVLPANATTDFKNLGITAGYDEPDARTGDGDPLLIHIDNITTAGTLRYLGGSYVEKANSIIRDPVEEDEEELPPPGTETAPAPPI